MAVHERLRGTRFGSTVPVRFVGFPVKYESKIGFSGLNQDGLGTKTKTLLTAIRANKTLLLIDF